MVLNFPDTLKSLKVQTQIQNEFGRRVENQTAPLIKEVDEQLSEIFAGKTLDKFALRAVFSNPLSGLNVRLQNMLFPLALEYEKKIREHLRSLGATFESIAVDFFQSVTARSIFMFSEWFVSQAEKTFVDSRALLETRGQGFYYRDGVKYYTNYSKKRITGETRKKLSKDKSSIGLDTDQWFDEELAKLLKEKGASDRQVSGYLKKVSDRYKFNLMGKTPEQISSLENIFVVKPTDSRQLVQFNTVEEF